ncbi:hypothetical protein FQN49_005047 [Arthroderma sp. PD_2]|nr:hypothetical protein FQN49_005047 [Arthroderma sp. PD_2]
MTSSILFPQFFLPVESFKLGRFTISIDYPHQGYHDPPCIGAPETIITPREEFCGSYQGATRSGFKSTLTSLMSSRISKWLDTDTQVTTDLVKTYILGNSGQWFTEAMSLEATRKEVVGQIKLPLGLNLASIGSIAPFGNILDHRVSGHHQAAEGKQVKFMAPGEQVCALQYRKVRLRWLSSRRMDKAFLSKNPRWVCYERSRDDKEGEEDMLEVEIAELEAPGAGGNTRRRYVALTLFWSHLIEATKLMS